jgi:hypothetical protein
MWNGSGHCLLLKRREEEGERRGGRKKRKKEGEPLLPLNPSFTARYLCCDVESFQDKTNNS